MCEGSSGEVVPVCTQHFRPALAVQNSLFFVAACAHGQCAATGHLLAMSGHGYPPEGLITQLLAETQPASCHERDYRPLWRASPFNWWLLCIREGLSWQVVPVSTLHLHSGLNRREATVF